jgi:hypothetical protein
MAAELARCTKGEPAVIVAILATIASMIWSFFVVFANAMSDAPGQDFQGGWTVIAAWLGTPALYLAW